jgi:hypothetical protein
MSQTATDYGHAEQLLAAAAARYQDQHVRICKGVEIRSLHLHAPVGWHPCRRSQTITVCEVALDNDFETVLLRWPGSGGYWKDVRALDVEPVK